GRLGVTNSHVVNVAAGTGQGQSHGGTGTHHGYVAIGAGFPLASSLPRVMGAGGLPDKPPAPGSAAGDPAACRGPRRTRRRARVPGGGGGVTAAGHGVPWRRDGTPRPQPRDRVAPAGGPGVRHRRPVWNAFR